MTQTKKPQKRNSFLCLVFLERVLLKLAMQWRQITKKVKKSEGLVQTGSSYIVHASQVQRGLQRKLLLQLGSVVITLVDNRAGIEKCFWGVIQNQMEYQHKE
ncbi:unnamed protein product [Fusarium graminearum]|nr:unnamed protein product [Fusarium graminearum]